AVAGVRSVRDDWVGREGARTFRAGSRESGPKIRRRALLHAPPSGGRARAHARPCRRGGGECRLLARLTRGSTGIRRGVPARLSGGGGRDGRSIERNEARRDRTALAETRALRALLRGFVTALRGDAASPARELCGQDRQRPELDRGGSEARRLALAPQHA